MKAIIEVDVPDYQIGQEVSIYFKDTMMIKGVVQEPSGDVISRQAVMDALCDRCELFHRNGEQTCLTKCEEYHFLATLPSVNPQERTGHWDSRTCKCSECGYQIAFSEYAERKYNYCPNCGAKMESEVRNEID